MLRTIAVVLLAIGMSVEWLRRRGIRGMRMHKAPHVSNGDAGNRDMCLRSGKNVVP